MSITGTVVHRASIDYIVHLCYVWLFVPTHSRSVTVARVIVSSNWQHTRGVQKSCNSTIEKNGNVTNNT